MLLQDDNEVIIYSSDKRQYTPLCTEMIMNFDNLNVSNHNAKQDTISSNNGQHDTNKTCCGTDTFSCYHVR